MTTALDLDLKNSELHGLPLAHGETAFHRRTIIAPGGTDQALPVGRLVPGMPAEP
jgi:hypothetical protein